MTVLENLELGAFNASARPNLKASLDDVLAHFRSSPSGASSSPAASPAASGRCARSRAR
jgi:hypothetical protein